MQDREYLVDLARFIMMLLIMLGHFFVQHYPPFTILSFTVPFFLVASGFYSAMSFSQKTNRSFWRYAGTYYIKRFFRILPPFLAVMLVASFFFTMKDIGYKLLFVANIKQYMDVESKEEFFQKFYDFHQNADHLWYVSLQEQLYFIAPFLFLLVSRERVVYLIAALIALSVVTREFLLGQYLYRIYGLILPVAIEYFLWGSMIYLIVNKRTEFKTLCQKILPVSVALLVVLIYAQITLFGYTLYHFEVTFFQTPMAIVLALICAGLSFEVGNKTACRIFEYLGSLSFSMFLVHPFIQYYFIRRLDMMDVVGFVASSVISILLAILIKHFVEKPSHKVRDYVLKRI